MALLPESPAIDAGDDAVCASDPVNGLDQRGMTRPQGLHCDIGAFEAATAADADGDGVSDEGDLCPDTLPGESVDAGGCSDGQVDRDADTVCDPSAPSGGPSMCIGADNCPSIPNTDQTDVNRDGYGDACVSPDVLIPPSASFGENPIIGVGTTIDRNVTFGDDNVLGDNVDVDKSVVGGDDVEVGAGTKIGQGTTLGDAVRIGPNVLIDRNVRIGSGVAIGWNCPVPVSPDDPRCVVIGKDSVLEDDVQIGVNVTLGRSVKVLSGTIIPDGTFIGKNKTVPPLP
jgi:acetyltransferase-like isoleucine patch superfamily enzyme